MTACTFTGVQLCTRMMQFSCIYIALSLLQFAVTFADIYSGTVQSDEFGHIYNSSDIYSGTGQIDELFIVSQSVHVVLILLFIATVYCLCNLMRQFGGVLRDFKLVSRAYAAWVLSVVVIHFSWFLPFTFLPDLLRLFYLFRPFTMLVDLAFFAVLFRSAYLTRQMLEREGEPEGRLYTPLVPSPGPPQSAPISPVVSHLEMQ